MTKIAYSLKEAALAAGVSESTLRRAISSNDLVAHYPTSKPIIKADELHAWIDNTPTESPRSA